MSNALAIAHVTQALALLIEANLQPEIDMAVKVEPRKPPADAPSEPTITVFPYQVTPNTSQRNNDLPTRASDGTLVKRPAAALDLHFLISAYGEESELVGQRLIGSVVRTLHEIPVLPADVIEQAGERPYLAGSDLAEAAQRVRFTPTVMDIDETSKLWGMLHQTPYTLSVVYQAALVFIEGRETPRPARPVEQHTVRVLPFGAPGAPRREAVGGEAAPRQAEDTPREQAPGSKAGTESGTGSGTEKTATKAPAGTAAQTPAKKTPAQRTPEKKTPEKPEKKAPAKTSAKTPAKASPAKTTARTPAKSTSSRTRKQAAPGGRSGQAGRTAKGADGSESTES